MRIFVSKTVTLADHRGDRRNGRLIWRLEAWGWQWGRGSMKVRDDGKTQREGRGKGDRERRMDREEELAEAELKGPDPQAETGRWVWLSRRDREGMQNEETTWTEGRRDWTQRQESKRER